MIVWPTLTGTDVWPAFGTCTGMTAPLSAPVVSSTVASSHWSFTFGQALTAVTSPRAVAVWYDATFTSPPGHITIIATTAASSSGTSTAATTIRTRRATIASEFTTDVSTT